MNASNEPGPKQRKRRTPSATAFGFIAAFGLSTATIIYTGLQVGAPRDRDRESAASAPAESTRQDDAAVSSSELGIDAGRSDAPESDALVEELGDAPPQ